MNGQSVLLTKKQAYLSIKTELESKDFTPEIEQEVQRVRAALVEKYEAERARDIAKCDCYLHVIDECLSEIETQAIQETLEQHSESEVTAE